VGLFYQRTRNNKRQILRRGCEAYTRMLRWPNARQSQTVYDIVFFIDA
jgi:hypothetical protein